MITKIIPFFKRPHTAKGVKLYYIWIVDAGVRRSKKPHPSKFKPRGFSPAPTMHEPQRKVILTSTQAVQIYNMKITAHCKSETNPKLPTASIAKLFGVSPKTVRDIWNGRTWYRETLPLDPSRADAAERLARRSGRPKGAKDKRQRTRKQVWGSEPTSVCCARPEDINMKDAEYPGHAGQAVASAMSCAAFCPAKSKANSPMVHISSAMGTKEKGLHWLEATSVGCADPFHDDWPHWKQR